MLWTTAAPDRHPSSQHLCSDELRSRPYMKPELNRSPAPVVSSTANPLNAFCSTRSVPRMATHPLSPKVTTAISHHSANLASAASILVSCSMESLLASPPPTSSLASSSLAEKLKKNKTSF